MAPLVALAVALASVVALDDYVLAELEDDRLVIDEAFVDEAVPTLRRRGLPVLVRYARRDRAERARAKRAKR